MGVAESSLIYDIPAVKISVKNVVKYLLPIDHKKIKTFHNDF